MIKILVIHGPNLNLLGSREPEVYGPDTLASIDQALAQLAAHHDIKLETLQSNVEGEIACFVQIPNLLAIPARRQRRGESTQKLGEIVDIPDKESLSVPVLRGVTSLREIDDDRTLGPNQHIEVRQVAMNQPR